MTFRHPLFAILAVAPMLGCRGDPVPARPLGLGESAISFNWSVKELAQSRPAARFVPYAGWLETNASADINDVYYEFRPGGPGHQGEHPQRLERAFGRLVAVHFSLDSTKTPETHLAAVAPHWGAPLFERCEILRYLDWTDMESVVLTWRPDSLTGQRLSARFLARRVSDTAVRVSGSLRLTLVADDKVVPFTGEQQVLSTCFSRALVDSLLAGLPDVR